MRRAAPLAIGWLWAVSSAVAMPPPGPGVTIEPERLQYLRKDRGDPRESNLARWVQRDKRLRETLRENPGLQLAVPPIGTANVPLLLGEYSDTSAGFSQAQFHDQIFANNPTGTMPDYYDEISYGQFQISGQTFGWYQAPQTQLWYACESGAPCDHGFGAGNRARQFVLDIATLADPTVDFAPFDNDGDCYVDTLMIVHTGGDAATGDSDNIWSHRWVLASDYETNDPCIGGAGNVRIRDYIIQPEEDGDGTSGVIVPIGVFCHEFGHALGLPDLYDTDYSSEGIGTWGLMAAGSYGGDLAHSETPSHMCAWSKAFLGWVAPTDVAANLYGEAIGGAHANQDVYRMRAGGATTGDEYFLIENRQQQGFDQYLPNGGLTIWHVDDTQTDNDNENRYWVDLEQADGARDLNLNNNSGDSADPFPGSTGNASLGPFTNPDTDLYDATASDLLVDNIGPSGAVMNADLIVHPGAAAGLQLGDADQSGVGDMADAQLGLRTLLGLEPPANCAYPGMLVSDDTRAGVEDIILIAQFANGLRTPSELLGPTGTPVQIFVGGGGQIGLRNETLPVPLTSQLVPRDASTCFRRAGIPLIAQIEVDGTGGASLRNAVTSDSGTLIGAAIPANDGFGEPIELTLGGSVGTATVHASIRVFDADGVFRTNAVGIFPDFIQTCGNAMADNPDEACDDGNADPCDGCTAYCRLPACGDGFSCAPEQCDDGDTTPGDGCDASCLSEDPCGDTICDLLGANENCWSCISDCAGPCAGDCCSANGTPGCNLPLVVDCVCAADPYCCGDGDGVWDGICAAEVDSFGCGTCSNVPTCGDAICDVPGGENCWSCPSDCGGATCTGECCDANGDEGCLDPMITACVCAVDPWCCGEGGGMWDGYCASEVDSLGCATCP